MCVQVLPSVALQLCILCEIQRKNDIVICFSASEIPKASQHDSEHSAVENRDPNKHQAASKWSNILTQLFSCGCQICSSVSSLVPRASLAAAPPNRRGRGRGNRSRGRVNGRRDGPMKFEEDFDFETANAQFHKDDIDKELQSKLKLKGNTVAVASTQAARFRV